MNGVLLIVGVKVRSSLPVRSSQCLVLLFRVVTGNSYLLCGVSVLFSELTQLFHAEGFSGEERSLSLHGLQDLGTLGVGRGVQHQVRESLRGEGKEGRRKNTNPQSFFSSYVGFEKGALSNQNYLAVCNAYSVLRKFISIWEN